MLGEDTKDTSRRNESDAQLEMAVEFGVNAAESSARNVFDAVVDVLDAYWSQVEVGVVDAFGKRFE
jgi:hypothetical protein